MDINVKESSLSLGLLSRSSNRRSSTLKIRVLFVLVLGSVLAVVVLMLRTGEASLAVFDMKFGVLSRPLSSEAQPSEPLSLISKQRFGFFPRLEAAAQWTGITSAFTLANSLLSSLASAAAAAAAARPPGASGINVKTPSVTNTTDDAKRTCNANGYPWLQARLADYPVEINSMPMFYEADARNGAVHEDVAQTIEAANWGTGDAAVVGKALAYVVHGGLDEAHNLVTPLSWAAPTPFSGPPKHGSPAKQDASYVHALIHRREGLLDGEFGTGFNNARFWWGVTGAHPVFPQLAAATKAVLGKAKNSEVAVASPVKEFEGRLESRGAWDGQDFSRLCETALRRGDPAVVQFARQIAGIEFGLLAGHIEAVATC